ncbi:hypothetical protein V8E53_005874 [Lactarius tabidus]
MGPRTRRQRATDTGPAATIPDSSTHTVRSKKKGKSTKTHRTLPKIVIKKPHTPALADSEVSGKHPLSPEEGPTIRTERGAKSGFPKPTKRIKSGRFEETHPPGLELPPTDDEAETTSQVASGFVAPGNVPPNRGRKLKRTETLIQEDDDDNSSLDNHCSHSSGSDGSDDSHPEVSEDDELDAIAEFIPTSKMAEKMALERPSWPTTTTEDGVQHQTAPSSVPLPSTLSSGEDIDVEFEHDQEANLEFTGAAFEGQQMTHVHAKHPQDDISDFSDTISEGLQVARVCPKGYVKGQRAAHAAARSERQPVSTLVSTDTGDTLGNQQSAYRASSQGYRGAHAPSSRQQSACVPSSRQQGARIPSSRQQGARVPSSHQQGARVPSNGQRSANIPSEDSQVSASGFTCAQGSQATSSGFKTTTPAISDDHVRPRNTKVPQLWPKDTDLCLNASGNIKLTDQTSIVRATITKAFGFLHASIVLENSYPDALLTSKFIQDALSTAALHVPDAEDVHVRILKDHPYFVKMSILPRARISIFRSEVKERCVAAIALLLGAHESATVISELVLKLRTDFNYIFLRRLNNANNNVLIGVPNISRPYRSSIIISVIRDLFFSGNTPFVVQHQALFPSREGTSGDVIWEVPKAMVALVSTAFYAALHEWESGERKPHDFTANAFMEAYSTHISSLDSIETKRNTSYHSMMAEIYQLAVNGKLRMDQTSSVPSLDLSVLED